MPFSTTHCGKSMAFNARRMLVRHRKHGILVASFWPAVQSAREAGPGVASAPTNRKHLALAAQNVRHRYKPCPMGRRRLSIDNTRRVHCRKRRFGAELLAATWRKTDLRSKSNSLLHGRSSIFPIPVPDIV